VRKPLLALALAAAALGPTACALGEDDSGPRSGSADTGTLAGEGGRGGLEDFALLSVSTKNTTRVGGRDAAADAAGVAAAVFPATNPDGRPDAVTVVDAGDWQGGLAASALAAPPVRSPVLVSRGGALPPVAADTLRRLRPKGSDLARDAQIIRVGDAAPPPRGLKSVRLAGADPYERAAAIDRFASAARGRPSDAVVVTSGERPSYAMPAGGWAARSGDAVLLTRRTALPPATARALREHDRPDIFVLGPPSEVSPQVEAQLKAYGRVTRIQGRTPAANSVEFARFRARGFGWGLRVPGYNFSLVSTERPVDGAAAASLASNGVFAPTLVTDRPSLPREIESYFLDVQPGYETDPSEGVYNRVWILGDSSVLSSEAQGRLDQVAELIEVQTEEPDDDDRGRRGGNDRPGGGGGGGNDRPAGGGPGRDVQ
jgi:hypothetical protein